MTTNSIIFTGLACFALILLIAAITLFARHRNANADDTRREPVGDYINDQIYVGNLPYRIDERDLQNYFSSYGHIGSIKIVRNFRTGRSKGYAFISYANTRQAENALAAHGRDLHGRSIVVRIAKPRPEPAYT